MARIGAGTGAGMDRDQINNSVYALAGSAVSASRVSCAKCGAAGHHTYQCRNHLTVRKGPGGKPKVQPKHNSAVASLLAAAQRSAASIREKAAREAAARAEEGRRPAAEEDDMPSSTSSLPEEDPPGAADSGAEEAARVRGRLHADFAAGVGVRVQPQPGAAEPDWRQDRAHFQQREQCDPRRSSPEQRRRSRSSSGSVLRAPRGGARPLRHAARRRDRSRSGSGSGRRAAARHSAAVTKLLQRAPPRQRSRSLSQPCRRGGGRSSSSADSGRRRARDDGRKRRRRSAGSAGSGGSGADADAVVKLFVGGIPMQWRESNLRDTFRQCGTVSEIIMLPQRGTTEAARRSNCAFVKMRGRAAAEAAMRTLDRAHVPGQEDCLAVRLAGAPKPGRREAPPDPELSPWESPERKLRKRRRALSEQSSGSGLETAPRAARPAAAPAPAPAPGAAASGARRRQRRRSLSSSSGSVLQLRRRRP
eukprot:TRINITY_DN4656_c1_g1_i2.p1 TRINITY_DN4656_c1_g1~~TRINITY_DN4656_c1_g1_i2.p1  ORF type:complete len:503 (+),score=133.55 TRINITY_DN4656_c1_g1_i2:81-1511(+)